MPAPNDPALVQKALAKAQSVEARLNQLIASQGTPLISYGNTTTVVTQSVPGVYTWTCPAGVTTAKVECWGAGGGGNAGNSGRGASGGGGGAYSQEPAYPVVPGTVYTYLVGDGGNGAIVSVANTSLQGGVSFFDINGAAGGVIANGGAVGSGTSGGTGGAATPGQTISFAGGNGAPNNNFTGGSGGGGSGGSTGAGGNGIASTSSTGTAGGAAGTGGGAAGGAGGNSAASGISGSAPGGGGGGVGAGTASGLVHVFYNPTSSATYQGSDAFGGQANTKNTSLSPTLWQNGSTTGLGVFNGTMKSMMILPSSVASDLSATTIDIITLQLFNNFTFYPTGTIVQLGYTGNTSLPSTYTGTSTSILGYFMPPNSSRPQNVETLAAPLKSGAAKALVLGPGPAYSLNYYSSAAGAGQLGTPVLNIFGHTGAANKIAGEGGDGQVQITYTVPGAMIAALQPAPVTDAAGNAMAAGHTGSVTAIQPGSSPTVLETWHNITLDASWATDAGYAIPQYRITPHGDLQLAGRAHFSFSSNTTVALNSSNPLPSAYRPANSHDFRYGDPVGGRCHLTVTSAGVINALPPSGATFPNTFYAETDAIVPLT